MHLFNRMMYASSSWSSADHSDTLDHPGIPPPTPYLTLYLTFTLRSLGFVFALVRHLCRFSQLIVLSQCHRSREGQEGPGVRLSGFTCQLHRRLRVLNLHSWFCKMEKQMVFWGELWRNEIKQSDSHGQITDFNGLQKRAGEGEWMFFRAIRGSFETFLKLHWLWSPLCVMSFTITLECRMLLGIPSESQPPHPRCPLFSFFFFFTKWR